MNQKEQVIIELGKLIKKGRLSPKQVVEWARSHPNSVLYKRFEWDNSKAAAQYRLWQARELITSVEVIYPDGEKRQIYVSPIQSRKNGGYEILADVLNDKGKRKSFLTQALDELERVCTRYNELIELAGVREAIQLVKKKT